MTTYAPSLNSSVKSGSEYTNPPYNSSQPYQFTNGSIPINEFPGNLDWSDRRSIGSADFYGIVITWWSNRDNRYATSYGTMNFSGAPSGSVTSNNFGLKNSAWNSVIYANGVPIADIGLSGIHCAGLNKELQPDSTYKTILWVVYQTSAYKFEVSVDPLTPGSTPPSISPLQVVPLSNSLPVPGATSVYLDLSSSHINSSGTKVITLQYYYDFANNYGKNVRILEHDLATGSFTVLQSVPSSPIPTPTYQFATKTRTGVTLLPYPEYSITQVESDTRPINILTRTGVITNPNRSGTQTITYTANPDTFVESYVSVLATDYKGDTPVWLISTSTIEHEDLGYQKTVTADFDANNSMDYSIVLNANYDTNPSILYITTPPTYVLAGNATQTVTVSESRSVNRTSTISIEHNIDGILATQTFTGTSSLVTNFNVVETQTGNGQLYAYPSTSGVSSMWPFSPILNATNGSGYGPYSYYNTFTANNGFDYFGIPKNNFEYTQNSTGTETELLNSTEPYYYSGSIGSSDLRVDYITVNHDVREITQEIVDNLGRNAVYTMTRTSPYSGSTSYDWSSTIQGSTGIDNEHHYIYTWSSDNGWSNMLVYEDNYSYTEPPVTTTGTTYLDPSNSWYEYTYWNTNAGNEQPIDWLSLPTGGTIDPATTYYDKDDDSYQVVTTWSPKWPGFATSSFDNNQIFSSSVSYNSEPKTSTQYYLSLIHI